MIILAIDPGPVHSGYVVLDTSAHVLKEFSENIPNELLCQKIASEDFLKNIDELAVEYIASYGMPLDDNTMRCLYWAGYFAAIFRIYTGGSPTHCLYRKTILAQICGTSKASDSNVSASLRNKFKEPLSPKRPIGPLKGMTKHAWSALAVAVTRAEGVVGVNHTWETE